MTTALAVCFAVLLLPPPLLAQAPSAAPVGSTTIGATATYRMVLQAGERDYAIAALPRPGSYVFELVSDHPPVLARIEPVAPLRPGTYSITIDSRLDDADRSFVFDFPVQPGRFVFTVTAKGKARYDIVLSPPVGSEHRTTFLAPQRRYSFSAAFALPRQPSRRRH
jgi:hypothetical protein